MSVPPLPAPAPPLAEAPDFGTAARLSIALQAPAWPMARPDAAAPPLVVVGHDYTGPRPPGDAAAQWAAGLPPDDPFLRLLGGLTLTTTDAIWIG